MRLSSWIKQLSAVDKLAAAFAEFIYAHAVDSAEIAAVTAGLVSSRLSNGFVCLDMREDVAAIFAALNLPLPDAEILSVMNDTPVWERALLDSTTVTSAGFVSPMVLENGRLYLQRYWNYERVMGEELTARSRLASNIDTTRLANYLDILFPDADAALQKQAALGAISRRLSIISGGPGTGKTTTAAGIIFLMLLLQPNLKIALAAPTGKAAARMMEAVASARINIEKRLAAHAQALGREEAQALGSMSAITEITLHRLLRITPDSPRAFYDEDNPLPYDLIIIDEASMIDSAMMAKFLKALSPEASCVILGDKDQLSSVEAGAVFFDICGSALNHGALEENVTILKKSWRFAHRAGIGALSAAVNGGAGIGELKKVFRENTSESGIELIPFGAIKNLAPLFEEEYKRFITCDNVNEALAAMSSFIVLSPVRETPFGVKALNLKIEAILEEAGLIIRDKPMYINRPIMITRNDYQLNLFNGDIGLVRENPSGERQIFFAGKDGQTRSVPPSLLPEHETVFAMTVHKSQGSEFENVLLVLPEHDMPILTKEVLYTGITRAKNKVLLFCKDDVLAAAVSRQISAASGLADRLGSAV